MASKATRSISAQNTGTDPVTAYGAKLVDISVSGIAGGTVIFLQRRVPGSTTWFDVESYVTDTQKVARNASPAEMRLFCKTGGYGSGTTVATITVGNSAA